MTLREAKEQLERENSQENIWAFSDTLFNYYKNDRWLHIIVSEDESCYETFKVKGKWFFGIYTIDNDYLPKEFPTIVTGIKKLIDTIINDPKVAGLILDPVDGDCFFVDREFIEYCIKNH